MVDANRFDALAASLVTATPSRRSLVSRVLGAVLAILLAVVGIGERRDAAGAKKRGGKRGGKRGKKRRGGKGGCSRCRRKRSRRARRRCRQRCKAKGGSSGGGGGGGGGGGTTQVSYDITINPAGFSVACPGGQGDCPADTTCVAEVCLDNCGPTGDCPTGYTCVAPVCLPTDVADDAACESGADCETGRCTLDVCVLCPVLSICGPDGDEVCCTVDATCENDVCVLQDN